MTERVGDEGVVYSWRDGATKKQAMHARYAELELAFTDRLYGWTDDDLANLRNKLLREDTADRKIMLANDPEAYPDGIPPETTAYHIAVNPERLMAYFQNHCRTAEITEILAREHLL